MLLWFRALRKAGEETKAAVLLNINSGNKGLIVPCDSHIHHTINIKRVQILGSRMAIGPLRDGESAGLDLKDSLEWD